jgi:hypothetical protein
MGCRNEFEEDNSQDAQERQASACEDDHRLQNDKQEKNR